MWRPSGDLLKDARALFGGADDQWDDVVDNDSSSTVMRFLSTVKKLGVL